MEKLNLLEFISISWNFNFLIKISFKNHRFKLENSFQDILYMIDVWINNGSAWNVESIKSQYINISTYRPLSGSFYMDLPVKLRGPRKGLILLKTKI